MKKLDITWVYFYRRKENHTNLIIRSKSIKKLKSFLKDSVIKKTGKNIEKIKQYYDDCIETDEKDWIELVYYIPDFVIFLSESKHKIKKKAEQAACKAYQILNTY